MRLSKQMYLELCSIDDAVRIPDAALREALLSGEIDSLQLLAYYVLGSESVAEENGQCCGARGAADPEGVKLELGRLVRRERRAWRVPTGAIGSAQTGHELSVCAWAWDAPRHHHVKISPVRISDSGSLLRGRERERGWPPLRTLVCVKEANWAGTRLRPAHVRASVSPSCAGRTLSCAAGKWRAARGVRSAGDA